MSQLRKFLNLTSCVGGAHALLGKFGKYYISVNLCLYCSCNTIHHHMDSCLKAKEKKVLKIISNPKAGNVFTCLLFQGLLLSEWPPSNRVTMVTSATQELEVRRGLD